MGYWASFLENGRLTAICTAPIVIVQICYLYFLFYFWPCTIMYAESIRSQFKNQRNVVKKLKRKSFWSKLMEEVIYLWIMVLWYILSGSRNYNIVPYCSVLGSRKTWRHMAVHAFGGQYWFLELWRSICNANEQPSSNIRANWTRTTLCQCHFADKYFGRPVFLWYQLIFMQNC